MNRRVAIPLSAFAILLWIAGPAWTQTAGGTGTAASLESHPGDAAMFAAEYEEALRRYRGRLEAGERSADLQFNMGLAAAQLERFGWAVYHFTQARFYAPGDDDIEAGRALLDAELRQRRGVAAGGTLTRGQPANLFWLELFSRYPRGLAELILIASSWLGFGLLLWRRRLPRGGKRDAAFVVSVLVLVVALNALVYRVGGDITRASIVTGVVVSSDPMLYEGPDRRAARAADPDLFEGAVVLIRDDREDWVGVELASGRTGWLTDAGIARIDVP